ncbi:MAG: FAD-dependent 5-carboxymethylaminomethyl-2-thiouridine(34) oxidoreductase MnmC [Pseudomonadota bacterium]
MPSNDATDWSPDAIILGAGVGGALTARLLADSGIRTAVTDPSPPSATESERRGALYIRPAVDYSPETRFAHQAFLAASAFYTQLQERQPENHFWYPTGTLSLAWHEREQQRQQKLLSRNHWSSDFLQPVSAREAASLSGLPVEVPGLWFPAGGHIHVDRLRRAALNHPLIHVYPEALRPEDVQGEPGRWTITPSDGNPISANTLVCAMGAGTDEWAPGLPLGRIRGQLTALPTTGWTPQVAVAGAGYALPPLAGRLCVGATFDRNSTREAPDAASDQANIDNLAQWFPSLAEQLRVVDTLGHWVGFRSTTPDHMPVAGRHDGGFILAGMGGKGLVYAPLLARHIAAGILGETSPLDADIDNRVSPARFKGF